jgi:AcrR family transcriptional regulator
MMRAHEAHSEHGHHESPAPRPSRRRLDPEARRAELLEAALSVLRERDPQDVRVEDVTRAAGAAKGTFYVYFRSWDDLLLQVRDHIVDSYTTDLRARMAAVRPSGWWPAFEAEIVRAVDYVVELGPLHQAVFHGDITEPPQADGPSADFIFAELLRGGIAGGACRPVDVQAAAPILFAVLHATADAVARTREREPHVSTMVDLLRSWLRQGPPEPEATARQRTTPRVATDEGDPRK